MPRRRRLRPWLLAIVLFATACLVWALAPIYGFVSQQYEVARSPLGWSALPEDIPRSGFGIDENLHSQALDILETRRAEIAAPSLSAAISVDGEIVWAGAVGWADIDNRVPATPDTIYPIGSTSKPVGITALARAVDAGQVELDAPIGTYQTQLPNPDWAALTLRQLASHTAGLPDYADNTDRLGFYRSLALQTRYDDVEKALEVFDGSELLAEPGSAVRYSGFDNILISAVLQAATRTEYLQLMQSEVFDPHGMVSTNATHRVPDTPERAVAYQTGPRDYKPWRKVDLSHKIAAGGFSSTPSDLVRLGAAWLDEDYISAETLEAFWTPVRFDGKINEENYALGFRRWPWTVPDVGPVDQVNHGGVSKGALCWLMIVPEHKVSLALSTNRRTDEFFDFADVSLDLLTLFLSDQTDHPVPASAPPEPTETERP